MFFFFKQKTSYEMRISDWSSDVCSSDLSERVSDIARANSDSGGIDRCMHEERVFLGGQVVAIWSVAADCPTDTRLFAGNAGAGCPGKQGRDPRAACSRARFDNRGRDARKSVV